MEHLSSPEFIISCEHAGNQIPESYRSLFDGAEEVLKSHRGWDPGALELAETISERTGSKLFSFPYTRLLIEPNRSIGHPKLFSEFTSEVSKSGKQEIVQTFYQPYRDEVYEAIQKNASKKASTIHISVHTFTPVFEGKERPFEIGLLYDPQRKSEKEFCGIWKLLLSESFPDFKIRMNQPYKGASDGFTTSLRKQFDEKLYLGIELEINQKLFIQEMYDWAHFCSTVSETLGTLQKTIAN